jgi:hypothetical protein
MGDIMTLAKERADRFGVQNVVVASNTGASVTCAHEVFGTEDYHLFAVGNPVESHEQGWVHHSGMDEGTRGRLVAKGITVILQEASLFQALGSGATLTLGQGIDWTCPEDLWGHCFQRGKLYEVIEKAGPGGPFNPVAIIYNTLQWFGDGPRVCIEVALMAADSGALPLDEDCIAIARPAPACNCPHAAVILHPTRTEDIFLGQLRIKDLVLLPGPEDHWFDDRPLWTGYA